MAEFETPYDDPADAQAHDAVSRLGRLRKWFVLVAIALLAVHYSWIDWSAFARLIQMPGLQREIVHVALQVAGFVFLVQGLILLAEAALDYRQIMRTRSIGISQRRLAKLAERFETERADIQRAWTTWHNALVSGTAPLPDVRENYLRALQLEIDLAWKNAIGLVQTARSKREQMVMAYVATGAANDLVRILPALAALALAVGASATTPSTPQSAPAAVSQPQTPPG